jgi:hypothetical protein
MDVEIVVDMTKDGRTNSYDISRGRRAGMGIEAGGPTRPAAAPCIGSRNSPLFEPAASVHPCATLQHPRFSDRDCSRNKKQLF